MKLKSLLITTCLSAVTLLIQPVLQAQDASPSPSGTPGAPPKFGGEGKPGGGGGGNRGGMRNPEERVKQLKEALALTPEQETKVRDLLKTQADQMQADRQANKDAKPDPEARRAKMTAAREKMNAAIKAILTPEQVTKYEAMKAKQGNRGPRPADAPKPPTP